MKIFIDIDNTIAYETEDLDYSNAKPILGNIRKANKLYDEGNTITYWTARGAESGIDWRDVTELQLNSWGVKYHELRLDKPSFDVFIDDKNLNSREWEKEKWIK